MNLIELIQQIFEIIFPVILIGLFILILKIFNSYHLYSDPLIDIVQFKKGITTYRNPPRPRSNTFDDYLHLALMSTPDYQRQLVLTVSDLIKRNIELLSQEVRNNFSENLILLIENPDMWLQQEYMKIKTLKKKRGKQTLNFLHADIYRIFTEVEEKAGIKIFTDKEILNL